MTLFDKGDYDLLKNFLMKILAKICDADPNILAEYVLVLLQHEKPKEEVYKICLTDLRDFLGSDTEDFVNDLFDILKYKKYLKKISSIEDRDEAHRTRKRTHSRRRNNRDSSSNRERSTKDRKYEKDRSYKDNSYEDYDRGKKRKNYDDDYNRESTSNSRSATKQKYRRSEDGSDHEIDKNSKRSKDNVYQSSRKDAQHDYSINQSTSYENNNESQNYNEVQSNQERSDNQYDPENAIFQTNTLQNQENGNTLNSSFIQNNPQLLMNQMYPIPQQNIRPQNPNINMGVPMNMGMPLPVNMGVPMNPGMRMGMGTIMNPTIGLGRPVGGQMPQHFHPLNPHMPGPPVPPGMDRFNQKPYHKQNHNSSRQPRNNKFNENRMNDGGYNRNAFGNKNQNDPFSVNPALDAQYVIEQVPEEFLSKTAVENYFLKFGELENVEVDVNSRSALVVFKEADSGLNAYRSADAIFGNRFVRIRKRRIQKQINKNVSDVPVRPEFNKNESYSLSNIEKKDVPNAEDIRKQYLQQQKELLELNAKKTQLVDMYMEKQKMLMQKISNPKTSGKLSVEAVEEIKSNIKKIQQLIKETLETTPLQKTVNAYKKVDDSKPISAEPIANDESYGTEAKNTISNNISNNQTTFSVSNLPGSDENKPKFIQTRQKPIMKLDFRPKTIKIENIPAESFETLRAELEGFGKVTEYEANNISKSAKVTYSQRWEAESAMKKAPLGSFLSGANLKWVESETKGKESTVEPEISRNESSILDPVHNSAEAFDNFDYNFNVNEDEMSWKL
ncbi:hypothetical protein BB558_006420 [Smittium angustum]|uniref:PWI domain-containing protein n=1 Tax=Smittium angustum TaxID=133377 RepID=A0A2U1IXT1_SMIAN|nr:hypothetical protein BB558_006420 [Smittium angustum]